MVSGSHTEGRVRGGWVPGIWQRGGWVRRAEKIVAESALANILPQRGVVPCAAGENFGLLRKNCANSKIDFGVVSLRR